MAPHRSAKQDFPPGHQERQPRRRNRRPAFLNLRAKSLMRGNLVVLLSLAVAFLISDFPHNRPTLWLTLPTALALYGMAETVRCMRPRWSFYHGGVLLCIYMDLMALSLIAFMLLYPYMRWLTASH